MRTLRAYLAACGEFALGSAGDLDIEIAHLTNDSRRVEPGSLFIAIRGERADGRDYIPQAIANGAAAVVYQADAGGSHSVRPRPHGSVALQDVPAIRVSNDYAALGRLAEFHYDYPAKDMFLVGVTGTNGKTTTAFLLREIFTRAGRQVGLIGTVRYELGDRVIPADRTTPTPLELQEMIAQMRDAGLETVVMEVSSHALCQQRLGTMRFDAAVFTNLTPEHLDYHGDMENYYQAKKLLFTRHLKSGGVSILNLDDEPGRRLAKELPGPILSYGLAEPAEVRPLEYRTEISGTELKLAGGAIHSPLSGDYNALNVLAAVAGARSCGIKDGVIQQAIEAFPGVPGRLQRVPNTRNLNIFIDYAHTSDALLNVLKNIRPLCSGESKLIAVFGCGGDRDSSKRPVMGGIAARLADKLVITSDNPRHEDPAAIIEQIMKGIPAETTVHSEIDRGRALAYAVAHARGGDTILVAGKGHEDCQEIKGVKHPFNDYDCIRAALVRASQEQTKV